MEETQGIDLHPDGPAKSNGVSTGHSQGVPGLTGSTKELSRALTEEEFDRYSRQMIVPGMGKDGMVIPTRTHHAFTSFVQYSNIEHQS